MKPVERAIHLVYPHGEAISCPDAIGRNLGNRLETRYPVRYYDWDAQDKIDPLPGDILLGHPHPSPRTTFRLSATHPGWSRRLMLNPFNLDLRQVAWIDGPIRRCDVYLAITGNYWFSRIERSAVAHWLPRMVHVDLAVDRSDFPRAKGRFADPGRRCFLYIGHSGWQKNPGYLAELARRLPGTHFGWVGGGPNPIAGFTPHGPRDFRDPEARGLVATYDFLLTASLTDANPATILEAMSWGLIPVCPPQSGYSGYDGIVNLPAHDIESAAGILSRLQSTPSSTLERLRRGNDDLLRRHFNWDRFAHQVVEAIEGTHSPALGPQSLDNQLRLRAAELVSPYSPVRPRNLRRESHRLVGGGRQRS